MAKKKVAKPLAHLRFDFVDALENVCNQSMILLQAVETVLQHDSGIKPSVAAILKERADAVRIALIGDGSDE